MKVLITGGLGYIGSHTAVELSNCGLQCVIVDCIDDWHQKINKLEKICKKPICYMDCDLLKPEDLKKVFESHRFDAVIHFAGLKTVDESVKNPLKYYEHNLFTTINLLKAMNDAKVKRLVFSSSATVYGDITEPPINEESPTSILNPYGRTKLMIEEILKDLAKSDSEWKIGILRYFNPIGAHESGLIGEIPIGIPNNLMPYIAQVASGVREKLNIFGSDYPTHDGTGVRDFIHVMDLAAGHSKMLDYLEGNSGSHVFNLGTGMGYSVLDLVHAFEEVSGIPIPYQLLDRRPGDIAISYANPSKAEAKLGWKAERNLKDMCIDAWRWQQQCSKIGIN